MTSTREQLKEAYRLIRQDQPQAAEQILRPILDAEPANVHAWWLLAYSVDDPYEVRDALHKVLELDPDYSNAPKAREMLQALEEQFFAAGAEDTSGYVADESGTSFEGEAESTFDHAEAHGPGYDDDVYDTVDESFFADDVLLDSGEPSAFFETEDEFGAGDLNEGDTIDDHDHDDPFASAAVVEVGDSHEDVAAAEEREARRAGRRGCVRIMLLVVLIVAVAVAGILLLARDDDAAEDPGALTEVAVDSPDIAGALQATEANLAAAGVGPSPKAFMASTGLGDTLIVEFCQEPTSDVSQNIALAMHTAAKNGANIAEVIDAVGVSVIRCDAEEYDTLYRAIASISDAQSYIRGALGDAQTGWIEFQRRWQKS